MRFFLDMRKMSRPYEMGLRLGQSLTLRPFSIVMWLIQKVFILLTASSSSGYHFNFYVPNRSAEQTRLSVYNLNPGPRCGKAGASESHTAAKWHTTLQEAMEYLEHDFLTNRFHVTHCGGCSILSNKDTSLSSRHPDLREVQDN